MRMRTALVLALAGLLTLGLAGCPKKFVEPEIAPTVTKPTNEPPPEGQGKAKSGQPANAADPSRNE